GAMRRRRRVRQPQPHRSCVLLAVDLPRRARRAVSRRRVRAGRASGRASDRRHRGQGRVHPLPPGRRDTVQPRLGGPAMTGPLVGVTVLQPPSGPVVLPGQSVTCSGRATGHGGLQTTLVDRVVLSLDGGSDVEATLSPVVPRPAVPAVNWAASVAAPGQPGPHGFTITAFPDDGGAS